ncbi:hypothetical protein ACQ3I4_04125 [Zafaria sp. Z1313]|uniref:hypothetical protein n=1 Tax=Zafaria sp. Z1313 TaxID=3423202 RepID=UPI003D3023B5
MTVAVVAASALMPLVVGVSAGDRTSPVRVFFDVTGERNLPTWWNSGLLMLAGFLSLCVGVPIAAAVLLFAWFAARLLPRPSRVLLAWGLGIFFAGAIGVEALTGLLLPQIGLGSPLYVALYHVEEFLECVGAGVLCVMPLSASAVERIPGSGLRARWLPLAPPAASPSASGAPPAVDSSGDHQR